MLGAATANGGWRRRFVFRKKEILWERKKRGVAIIIGPEFLV